MKKIVALIFTLILVFSIVGCSESNNSKKPEISQIRSICELSTLKCYYHNVAKSTKTAGSGFTNLFDEDRIFWIEYTGIAEIGIDMSEVKMNLSGTDVTVELPKAKLLNIDIDDDTFNKKSFFFSEDSFWNGNKITATDQTKAINKAQKTMKKTVKKNKGIFLRAQEEAKKLIENYIDNLGKLTGEKYNIKWKEL